MTQYQKNAISCQQLNAGFFTHNHFMTETLGDRLRRERELAGLSQKQLAQRAGYRSQTSISAIENGVQASSTKITKLAKALGLSASYLETGSGTHTGSSVLYASEPLATPYSSVEQRLLTAFRLLTSTQQASVLADVESKSEHNSRILAELMPKKSNGTTG